MDLPCDECASIIIDNTLENTIGELFDHCLLMMDAKHTFFMECLRGAIDDEIKKNRC